MVFIPPTTERTCRCSSCDFVFTTATISDATLVFCPSCGIQFLPRSEQSVEPQEHCDTAQSVTYLVLPEMAEQKYRRRNWYYRFCLLLTFSVQAAILLTISVAAFQSYKQPQLGQISLHLSSEQEPITEQETQIGPTIATITTIAPISELPHDQSDAHNDIHSGTYNDAHNVSMPLVVDMIPPFPIVELDMSMTSNLPALPTENQLPEIPPLPGTVIDTPPPKTGGMVDIISREDRQKLIKQAEEMIDEAKRLRGTDSRKSLELIWSALTTFRQQGYPMASSLTWLLSQVMAEQSWGMPLETGPAPINVMAVSPDNLWLLTGSADNTVVVRDLWRQEKNRDAFFLDRVTSPLVKVLYTPGHTWMVWGQADGTIRMSPTMSQPFSVGGGGTGHITLPERVEGLRNIIVSPDDRWLIAFGGNETGQNADMFDVALSQRHNTTSEITQTSFNEPPTNWTVVDTQKDERSQTTVYLWDLSQIQNGRPGQPILLRGHERPVRTAMVSPDSRWLVTGSDDGSVRVFDLRSIYPGAEQAVLKGHHLDVTTIAIAPNNKWFATGNRDNTIRLWAMPHLNSSLDLPLNNTVFEGHIGWISKIVIDSRGENLISGSYDNTVKRWTVPKGRTETANQKPTVMLDNVQGAVTDLLLSYDGNELYSLGTDGSLCIRKVWSDDETIQLKSKQKHITGMSLTVDGRWLVLCYVNESDPMQSGISLWPLRLDDLMKTAETILKY